MTERSANVLAEALTFSEEERAEMVEELIESLDGRQIDNDWISEEELLAELDRRAAELREHPEREVDWEHVKELRP